MEVGKAEIASAPLVNKFITACAAKNMFVQTSSGKM